MQILFTSASSSTALALARVLAAEGHIVHAADQERIWGTSPARYSRAYRRFHRLDGTWSAAKLWKAIGHDIDLIIPFGPLPGHFTENLKAKGANIIGETLTRDDSEFQDFVRDNVVHASSERPSIIQVPASFTVHSRACIAEILSNRESTFSLHPLPCYDTDDEDTLVDVEHANAPSASLPIEPARPLVLSCSTLDDRTVEAIKRLPMSATKPYRLIEVAEGGSFYSAHAFVHSGRIRSFVVTNAKATDANFVVVGINEPLYDLFYRFTQKLVKSLEGWQTVVANHLNLTFHLRDKVTYGDFVRIVTVVSCHNQPHASLTLLATVPELRQKLALAYTSPVFDDEISTPVQFPPDGLCAKAMYSAPLAASEIIRAFLQFRPWQWDWWSNLARITMMCWVWGVNFKEEMWEANDPGPAMCLWTVMIVDGVLKTMRRTRGVRWVVTHIANRKPQAYALIQISKALLTLCYDIWSYSFAMLLYPWGREVKG